MRIHLVAVGERVPDWVQAGYDTYARRLPAACALRCVEVTPPRRHKGEISRAVAEEGRRLRAARPEGARTVLLDRCGEAWSTAELVRVMEHWLAGGRDVALMIGGPDGLHDGLRAEAERTWSLSPLTLPHALVRVVVAEQIYRAWSHLQGHPYHR